jgi:hypothetical protein
VAELEGDTSTISGVSTVTELDQKPVITLDTLVSAEGIPRSTFECSPLIFSQGPTFPMDNDS